MPISADQAVVPHQLCRWCKVFITDLQKDLLGVAVGPETDDRHYSHFPNIGALIDGSRTRTCHLCSILFSNLEERARPSGVNVLIQKTNDLVDSGSVDLLTIVQEIPRFSQHHWKAFDIFVGTRKANGPQTLRILTHGHLMHNLDRELEEDRHEAKDPIALMGIQMKLSSSKCSPHHIRLILEGWLTTCRSRHASCRPRSGLQVPTRLLDLHDDGNKLAILVPGAKAEGAHYAALSYCWGQTPQLMLLPSNYEEFEKGIPFTSLTKVAQDAFTVCRALSIRYLWLDAMCIIQGPDGDFQHEAARMEDVYAGSLVTIVAAASPDPTHHFLTSRNPLQWMDLPLHTPANTDRYRSYVEGRLFCEYLTNMPGSFAIDDRGWCFQERLLAPRSLYFGDDGIHWECRGGLACEYIPKIEAQHGPEDRGLSAERALKSKYAGINELDPDTASPLVSYRFRELWGAILERYFETQVSFETDRLVAMTGLARSLEHRFAIKASYGLWLTWFLDEVLWSVVPSSNEKPRYLDLGPSWSWVNLRDCRIFTSNTLHEGEDGEEHHVIDSISAEVLALPAATDFAETMKGNFSHRVDPATLAAIARLRGRLRRCSERRIESSKSPGEVVRVLDPLDCPTDTRRDVASYRPDAAGQGDHDLYCLLVRREYRIEKARGSLVDAAHNVVDEILDWGLVLRKVEAGGVYFRRVGFFVESLLLRTETSALKPSGRDDMDMDMYMFPGRLTGRETEVQIG